MSNPKINSVRVIQLGLACLLIMLLAAFGCKEAEEAEEATTEEIVTSDADEVTFTSPSLGTDTTTDTTDVTDTTDPTDITTDISTNVTDPTNTSVNTTETNTTSVSTSSSNQEEDEVLKFAETLAEIYGTYTNKDKQSFKNLQDIKPYASQKMSAWLDSKAKGATTTNSGAF